MKRYTKQVPTTYTETITEWCCKKMKTASANGYIVPASGSNILLGIKHPADMMLGRNQAEYTITYCPFCGDEILYL